MKILLLAGEQSGKVYADRIRELMPDAEFRGYEDFFRIEDLAVMGIIAVLRRIRFFLRVKRTMIKVIDDWRPDAVVTIDYPGMNLKLSSYAKSKGIPTVHLVCPQVWAWKKGRIPKIPRMMNRLLCFFPFEPAIFEKYEGPDFRVSFMGHPLVDIFAEERRAEQVRLPWGRDSRHIALLPGSRRGEIQRNFSELLKAARELERRIGDDKVSFIVPAATSRARVDLISRLDMATEKPHHIQVIDGRARQVLLQSDAAAVASGTATLEAALARVPTVLVYKVSIFFEIFVRIMKVKGFRFIGLANIIAGREVMPELLQRDFTAEAVADRLESWVQPGVARDEAIEKLDATMKTLESGTDGAFANAVREIREAAAK